MQEITDNHSNEPIYVGLSGGVDSALSVAMLHDNNFDLKAVYAKCYSGQIDGCDPDKDIADALQVASLFEVPFEVWDFTKDYSKRVLDSFYKDYKNGRTPNPDILCNSEIKFGIFLDEILKKNPAAKIATGHYSRILKNKDGIFLREAVDKSKDQSYFLYRIAASESILDKIIFPVGALTKKEVRKRAKEFGLHVATKKDSTGICFIGNVDLRKFLAKKIEKNPGIVKNIAGEQIGEHDGIHLYTIGQRHGFRLSKHFSEPQYVIEKDLKGNVLVVGSRKSAYSKQLIIEDYLVHPIYKDLSKAFEIRIRHLGEKVKVKEITPIDKGRKLKIELQEKMFAITPGQSAVLYAGEIVVGGGIICDI